MHELFEPQIRVLFYLTTSSITFLIIKGHTIHAILSYMTDEQQIDKDMCLGHYMFGVKVH